MIHIRRHTSRHLSRIKRTIARLFWLYVGLVWLAIAIGLIK